jgi:molybdopterin converting factor small subunit
VSTAVIRIPTPLRSLTRGADEVRVEGATVRLALEELGERCPGVLARVLGPDGAARPFVNLFVGAQDVRALQGLDTPLADGAVISIVPAVAGGRTEVTS